MLHLRWRINLLLLLLCGTLEIMAQSTSNSRAVVIGTLEDKPNAILYLNPEDKNQGFLLPQLTTPQRLAIPANSPSDDGLMVFDKDLRELFLWKNNAWTIASGTLSTDNSASNEVITAVQLVNNEFRITEAGKSLVQSLNGLQLSGDASGTLNSTVVNKLQGNALNSAKLTALDNGKSLTWNGTQWIAQTPIDNSMTNEVISNIQVIGNDIRITEGPNTASQSLNAVSLTGDATGPLNNTSVTRIQGNAVNNTKLTVADNGKLLVWNGTQWLAQTVASISTQQYYTVDPSAFTILKPDGKADKHNMVIFESDDAFVTVHSRAEGGTLIAPLNLPHGATIQNIAMYYMDRDAENIQLKVLRKAIGGSNEELVNWTSSGSSASVRNSTFSSFNAREIIDNNAYTYRLEVKLNPTSSADRPSDASHRVYGLKIRYQP